MAYSEHIISFMTDIPPLVHAFASSLGFDVTGTTAEPIVRHPNFGGAGPGGVAFKCYSTTSGNNRNVLWEAQESIGGVTPKAIIRAPIFATPAAPSTPLIQHPTKLHLIGMLTPEPYIAIITEHGYNLHRHLYLGFMEKIGDYVGGEVISSQNGPAIAETGSTNLLSRTTKNHLFSSRQFLWSASESGGVRILDGDNAVTWRRFRNPRAISSIATGFVGDEVMGGFGDSINDPLIAKALCQYSGANILVPVNLYATQPVTGEIRFRPIGRPPGVRFCNMHFLEPQTIMNIGTEVWRAFAGTSKRDTQTEPAATSSSTVYRQYESSQYLGYAYRSA
jgi:hypothetical protein